MKRIFYLACLLALASCLSEKKADPGKPATFLRYFNGGNEDRPQAAQETVDGGIVILATTKIQPVAPATDSSKIKLIKTDLYGNVLYQKVFPENFASGKSIGGRAFIELTGGGFIVIGDRIQANRKDIFILEVDSKLDTIKSKTISFTNFQITESIEGRAIQLNTNGNYLILGGLTDPSVETNNMILAELDKTDFSVKWARAYGNGASTLANKLFLDSSTPMPNVFWSGTVKRNSSDMRLVETEQNSLVTLSDSKVGKSDFQEFGNDICRFGYGFAVVGSTNEKSVGVAGDKQIIFKILTEKGTEQYSKSFGFDNEDVGNAVCSARGGLVILGTSTAVPENLGGKGEEDYYLWKIDALGNEIWKSPKVFGSKNQDLGVSVSEMKDGSLLILGQTIFGNLKTIMLMKTDSEGNID